MTYISVAINPRWSNRSGYRTWYGSCRCKCFRFYLFISCHL